MRVVHLVVAGLLTLVAVEASAQQSAGRNQGEVARGRYIVEQVAMCGECHSTRDDRGGIVPGTRFMGGALPVRPTWASESDWALRAPRIAGLPGYTDQLATRLLTEGAIGRNGVQLRAPMPRFRMTTEDAAAVAAYLRSIQ
jgi:mono/diheme cytochrome c family protein